MSSKVSTVAGFGPDSELMDATAHGRYDRVLELDAVGNALTQVGQVNRKEFNAIIQGHRLVFVVKTQNLVGSFDYLRIYFICNQQD